MLRFFSSCFLYLSLLITGCSSADSRITLHKNSSPPAAVFVVDINSAGAAELESLPHVGPALARKIIEHRERYGPFRRVEHLLVIEGMSENRFRDLRQFINTE
jgi:competence protein ComEA